MALCEKLPLGPWRGPPSLEIVYSLHRPNVSRVYFAQHGGSYPLFCHRNHNLRPSRFPTVFRKLTEPALYHPKFHSMVHTKYFRLHRWSSVTMRLQINVWFRWDAWRTDLDPINRTIFLATPALRASPNLQWIHTFRQLWAQKTLQHRILHHRRTRTSLGPT